MGSTLDLRPFLNTIFLHPMTVLDWLFPFRLETPEEGHFTLLRPAPILKTIQKLEDRIAERFPDSGLLALCKEFNIQAHQSEQLAEQMQKPIWLVRVLGIASIILLVGLVIWAVIQLISGFHFDASGITDLLQTTESAINELIFLGLAVFFLMGFESRLKRRVVLKSLHRLRSIAHVVDMHQLTKDPAFLLSKNEIATTASSPVRTLTRHQLMRYLDYCSELLALNAKIAALFAQNTDDEVVLNAINDLEQLMQGLSVKIWQKIMILDLSTE